MNAHAGHSIGVAAATVGLHPQTLREWERHGLVVPVRTPGGTRRYRDVEIARLKRIVELSGEGVSLAGVRYVLDLEDRLAETSRRISKLEALLDRHAPEVLAAERQAEARAERARTERAMTRRSFSLEIVHVPQPRRGPRWRNDD